MEGKRIFLKRKLPNPVFQGWLEELYEEARVKKSKLESMLGEALNSLSKYPLPLKNGADCAILKGFDRRLCLFLDKRLEAFNENINLEPGQSCSPIVNVVSSESATTAPNVHAAKKHSEINNRRSSIENNLSRTNNSNDCTASCSSKAQTSNKSSRKAKSALQSKNNGISSNEALERSNTNDGISSSSNKNSKSYEPAFRSGSYAILMALLEHSNKNRINPCMKKEELINAAQKYSEESFTRPKPQSYYTAWSSMRILLNKNLVQHVNKKSGYVLTDLGVPVAIKLMNETKNTPTANDIIFNNVSSSINRKTTKSSHQENTGVTVIQKEMFCNDFKLLQETNPELQVRTENIMLPAFSFDVVLIIDKQETSGISKKNDPTVAQFKKYPDLKYEFRSLKVGDYIWIAKSKEDEHEVVTPYIVERKRMDDLSASIKDGRFHEQKFRLRKSGIKNVIYLIENYGSNLHLGMPIQSLKQALANTRVHDGFKVHITSSLTDSVKFLAMMTKRLTIEFKDKNIIGTSNSNELDKTKLMTFNLFNKSSTKTVPLTVTQSFIKLLIHLKGLSPEKVWAITKVYETPKSLLQQYETCTQKEGEMLLANIKYGDSNRNVGPHVSKAIYYLFK